MIAWRYVVEETVDSEELFRVVMADMFELEYLKMIKKMFVIIVAFGHVKVFSVSSC